MKTNTNAIVLSRLKYKDNSLIVTCFTQELGIQSYLLHHVLKRKKGNINPSYFQLLTQLELQVSHKPTQSLHRINDVKLQHAYISMHTNIYKSTVVLFLAEVLQSILKEESKNNTLYTFIENALLWYDLHDFNANFHLLFLLKLAQHLGIAPNNDSFFKHENNHEKVFVLETLLGTTFDNLHTIKSNAITRQAILTELLDYFKVHLGDFKNPKSLKILHEVFN